MNQYDQLKRGETGAWLSITVYLLLAAIKVIIGNLSNSQALQADGLNNTTDVIASLAVLIGLRISRKPPDSDHHYGHFRAELIASLIASFIMVTVGFQVIVQSIQLIWNRSHTQPDMIAAWIALASSLIMLAVYWFNSRLAKRINSSSLHAASQDNRSDALISFGAFIGIIGAQIGWYWLDPVAGLIVGILIVHTAWSIFRNSSHSLTDGFDQDLIEVIREHIAKDQEVIEVRDIKGRRHGNQTLLDIIIYVDPNITVEHGHKITDRIEETLEQELNIPYAHIHVEPYHQESKHKINNSRGSKYD
ncbi:cation diffusion facilitator family transporter [Amphibacillus sediminis]|uniref:cation diffusion facilitator family transporter n=1 Tax=Amphibacillus sediminis TaxID=360185 RepID=UPI00082DB7BD|nr:cation diffusion facilitator family transporter [Amphibacillus sediminis]